MCKPFTSYLIIVCSFFMAPTASADVCGQTEGAVPGDVIYWGQESSAALGTGLADAGDLNGDAMGDLIIGAPFSRGPDGENHAGRVMVVFGDTGNSGEFSLPPGSDEALTVDIRTRQHGAKLGYSVVGLGDMDGDGFPDIALGMPGATGYVDGDDDDNVVYTGAVQIIYGQAQWPGQIILEDLPHTRIIGADKAEHAGAALASAGDLNGDGLNDLVISAPRATINGLAHAGRVYIIYGRQERRALVDLETDADVVIQGTEAYAKIGWSVTGMTDFNGDGLDDIAIGAPYADTEGVWDAGYVAVLYGATNLPAHMSAPADFAGRGIVLNCSQSGAHHGWSLSRVDLNDDGMPDLVAGAPDAVDLDDGKHTDKKGLVSVLFGDASGALPDTLDIEALTGDSGLLIVGEHTNWKAGYAVAGVGDINADGRDDLLISAPRAYNGAIQEAGAVYILHGRDAWPAVISLTEWSTYGDRLLGSRSYARFGEVLAGAGDHNGDAGPDFAVAAPKQSEGDELCAGSVSVFAGDLLPKPSGLTCSVSGLTVSLAWSNPYDYDHVLVWRDGAIYAALPGDATAWEDADVSVGPHAYLIRGLADAVQTNAVSCEVSVQVLPVSAVNCVARAKTVYLDWSLSMTYESIQIKRDGDVVADLPGNAASWEDADVPHGHLHYEVSGVVGAFSSVPVSCHTYAPPPPSEIACWTAGRQVLLMWWGLNALDSIRIFRDGQLLTEVPGDTGSFMDNQVPHGEHTYGLFNVRDGNISEEVGCTIYVLQAPENLGVSVLGDTAELTWTSPEAYDAVVVFLEDETVAELPGHATSHALSGLAPGTYQASVAGQLNDVLSEKTPITFVVLPAPGNLTCSADAETVTLTWENLAAYETITILRDDALLTTLAGTHNSHVDDNVEPGEHVYSISGTSGNATSASVTCAILVYLPPDAFSCSAVADEVTLGWTNNGDYGSLILLRDGAALDTLPGDAVSYVDQAVDEGTHYYTLYAAGDRTRSAEVVCEVVSPGAPSNADASAVGPDITVTWENGDDYDSIIVRRNGEEIDVLPAGSTAINDPTGEPGETYTYTIVGVIDGNTSAPATTAITLPLLPTNVACSANGPQLWLTWAFDGDVDGFRIYLGEALVAELPGNARSFETEAAVPGDYRFGISALLGAAVSEPLECEVSTLAPPSELSCVSTGGVVTIAWLADAAFESILVFRNEALIAELPGDAEGLIDDESTPGDHLYEVVGRTGESFSDAASCQIHVPAPVAALQCLGSEEGIRLTWEAADKSSRVVVYRNDEQLAELEPTAVTYLDADFAAGVAYTYAVVNMDQGNSAEGVACMVRVPLAPEGLVCTGEGDAVHLSWSNPDDYDALVLTANGEIIADDLAGDQTVYDHEGLAPGVYAYVLRGRIGGDTGLSVSCEVTILPSPEDLQCTIMPEAGTVRLTWTNPVLYEAIIIRRNGDIIDGSVDGQDESYQDDAPGPGVWTYAVTGSAFDTESRAATCEVTVLAPPTQLSCVGENDTATLTWVSGGAYDTIRVLRNGAEAAVLPGTATSYKQEGLASGLYTYRLIGETDDGAMTMASAQCEVTIVPSPENLLATVVVLGLSGRVTLTWDLAGLYDSISVKRTGPDGTQYFGPLPGNETRYVDDGVPEGSYVYQVIAFVGSHSAESEEVAADIVLIRFIRGDANGDDQVDLADAIWLLNYLFRDGLQPPNFDAADADDSGSLDVTDVIYIVDWRFNSGAPPPPPFPSPGVDP